MQDAIILYENGKAIGGEGHPTDADDITFDNTGTDIESTDVDGAIKEVNVKTSGLTRMTTLWENPAPTASFSAQTITLNSADYDFLLLQVAMNTTYSNRVVNTHLIKKNQGSMLNFTSTRGASYTTTYTRVMSYVSDTSYSFDEAKEQNSNGSQTTNNADLIPLAIYGIKLI